jgi:hypothetical protein
MELGMSVITLGPFDMNFLLFLHGDDVNCCGGGE